MPKLPNTLVILPYDPNWKTEFEHIRDYLMEHIGDLVIEIKHIGSTSVPLVGAIKHPFISSPKSSFCKGKARVFL